MPQLVKGGKYVFGWSTINNEMKVRIPEETFEEYNFNKINKIILISGSKSSGGFSILSPEIIVESKLGHYIKELTGYSKESDSFSLNELEIVNAEKRFVCWTFLDKERYFHLSEELIALLNLRVNNRLLVVRGSGLGPGFIAKGVIYNEALKHENLLEFQ